MLISLRCNLDFSSFVRRVVHPGSRNGLASPLTVRKDERTAGVRLENSNCQVLQRFFKTLETDQLR